MPSLGQRVRRSIHKIQWEFVRGGPGRAARVLTVPTANGLLSFSNMDLHNARTLFVHREWELDLITRAMDYLRREGYTGKPGADVMVDVGANIGMICVAMLRLGHFKEALAFEPGPENFQFLTRNIEQNRMKGAIRPFPFALTESSGEVEMELSEENYGDHRVRSPGAAGPGLMGEDGRRTVRVPARSLDEVLASMAAVDPRRIGLIWVDTQGHEGHFFRGARKTLAHRMPVLSEFWPYGILRSGLDRESYAEIVRSLFSHLVVIDGVTGPFERRDAAGVRELFDACPRWEQFLEVIFFPR